MDKNVKDNNESEIKNIKQENLQLNIQCNESLSLIIVNIKEYFQCKCCSTIVPTETFQFFMMIFCSLFCIIFLMISIIGLFTISIYNDQDIYCNRNLSSYYINNNNTLCDTTLFYKTTLNKNTGYIFVSFGSIIFIFITFFILMYPLKKPEQIVVV